MTEVEKSIIVKAVKIRVKRGEDSKEIINKYTKLTDQEKYEILTMVKGV